MEVQEVGEPRAETGFQPVQVTTEVRKMIKIRKIRNLRKVSW